MLVKLTACNSDQALASGWNRNIRCVSNKGYRQTGSLWVCLHTHTVNPKLNSKPSWQAQASNSESSSHQLREVDAVFKGGLDTEIVTLALPTLATLAADPVASLVGTAYIGHLGSIQLAGVGIALSIYGSITKLLNVPLLAVTTSVVAGELGKADTDGRRENVGAACSSALFVALVIGLAEVLVLGLASGQCISLWGSPVGSPMRPDALGYLQVRALGAPATVLLLVAQGVFRGLGDTQTPLWATIGCNVVNVAIIPLLVFVAGWGVKGAAAATVLAELGAGLWLLTRLAARYPLRLTGDKAVEAGKRLLEPSGLLAVRTVAITSTFALATALAARTDPSHAACHQLWLASSLLADSLAVAAQSLMARTLAAGQRAASRAVAQRTAQLAFGLGSALAVALALGRSGLPRLFTSDPGVLAAIDSIFPWVALTQPVNALAFVADGILYGANGFGFAARVLPLCAMPAVACMLIGREMANAMGPSFGGLAARELTAVWAGLTVLMAMRAITIYLPFRLQRGPFRIMYGEEELSEGQS